MSSELERNEILDFIKSHNGKFYHCDLVRQFPGLSPEVVAWHLDTLRQARIIANGNGYSPYRLVRR